MDRSNATGNWTPVADRTRISAALVDFRIIIDDQTQIRLLRVTDAAALHDLILSNREHLTASMSWIDGVTDPEDTYAFVRSAEREAREHTAFKAGIWQTEHLIGAIDLHDIDWPNASARVGYWLDRAHTARGIMTAAVSAFSRYAFEALDLHRLEIRAQTGNHRSRRIPERLGFALEGILRDAQLLRGVYYDHALYALINQE